VSTEYKVIKEKIVYFENAIPDASKLVATLERLDCAPVTGWSTWDTGGDAEGFSYGEIKYLNRYSVKYEDDQTTIDESLWVMDTISNAMKSCAKTYASIFDIDEVSTKYACNHMSHPRTTMGVSKYFPDRQMGPHIDWNESNSDIEYTVVVYLNDNYDGGELEFVEPELDVKIKPKAGSIVMFPSFMPYKHQSCNITNGRKMLITHHWKGGERVKRVRHLVSVLRSTE
jgi:hypothetical protein